MEIDQETKELVAERLAEKYYQAGLETRHELECMTVQKLAGMLDLSTSQTHRLLDEYYDFGPRDTRVSLAQAKAFLESRLVKGGKRRKKGVRTSG
ncbi:MAG: hypothetical protein QM680_10565 [Luteolibacter sp.]